MDLEHFGRSLRNERSHRGACHLESGVLTHFSWSLKALVGALFDITQKKYGTKRIRH